MVSCPCGHHSAVLKLPERMFIGFPNRVTSYSDRDNTCMGQVGHGPLLPFVLPAHVRCNWAKETGLPVTQWWNDGEVYHVPRAWASTWSSCNSDAKNDRGDHASIYPRGLPADESEDPWNATECPPIFLVGSNPRSGEFDVPNWLLTIKC